MLNKCTRSYVSNELFTKKHNVSTMIHRSTNNDSQKNTILLKYKKNPNIVTNNVRYNDSKYHNNNMKWHIRNITHNDLKMKNIFHADRHIHTQKNKDTYNSKNLKRDERKNW